MQLTYNSVALHALGTLRIAETGSELIPKELPVRRQVTLSVRLDFFADTWAANRLKVESVRTAVAVPHARLLWVDDADLPGRTIVDKDVTLAAHTLPEDINSAGQRHQAVYLTFVYDDPHFTSTGRLALTYTPTGGSATTLGVVYGHRRSFTAERYSPTLKHRIRAAGRATFTGEYLIDPAETLTNRRSAGIAAAAAMETALNSAEGTMLYTGTGGDVFNKVVRVLAFNADPDQLTRTGLPFSVDVEYSLFPDESSYAAADITVETRTDTFGRKERVLSGRIAGNSEAACLTKLTSLRSTFASGLLPLSRSGTARNISTPDGDSFIEYTVQETYRQDRADNLELSIEYIMETRIDYASNVKSTRLSGRVNANNRTDAEWCVDQVAACFTLGTLVEKTTGESRLKYLGDRTTSADDLTAETDTGVEAAAGYLDGYTFDRLYQAKQSGTGAILECSVSEDIQYSGVRWVVQPTAYGRDVMQACGIASGSRRLSGRVVATTETAARAWLNRQYYFPFVSGTTPGTRYINPPRTTCSPVFLRMVDGVFRDGSSLSYNPAAVATNETSVAMDFEFSEILPTYDYTPA